jgi:hypothetical protein
MCSQCAETPICEVYLLCGILDGLFCFEVFQLLIKFVVNLNYELHARAQYTGA